MNRFGILLDDLFKQHDAGPGHPERPERLDAIRTAIEQVSFKQSPIRIAPVDIEDVSLHRVHPPAYVARVRRACEQRQPIIDEPDCGICPESYRIARHGAGGIVDAARRIARGELQRAFCAIRPPGHHAERDRAMGFCLFGNAALAATALCDEFEFTRIAIIDWDVHHGNGTQHLLEDDPRTLFISLHGHPLYPGTGMAAETGRGTGAGLTLNIPLPAGTDDMTYRSIFKSKVVTRLNDFAPQIILISAGFDAHADDPLGNLALHDETFRWLTQQVIEVANSHAAGRILSLLEGGYNLEVLRRCVADHVQLLANA